MVLLISTYDLGRQPFGLASAAAALRAAQPDREVVSCDLAKQRLDDDVVKRSDVVAFFLPMHTATRMAMPVIDRVREINPSARLIAYGLYAPLNEALLREHGVSEIAGGEFEDDLVTASVTPAASNHKDSMRLDVQALGANVPRVTFRVPDRAGLLPLSSYAMLETGNDRAVAGYTEASRGCKHRCRHCPIVPVYDGRFRIVPADIVMADVRAQVAAGARHVTFGDPDFFNGIRHAEGVIDRFAQEFPSISYDVTIKIEHLLKHSSMLRRLRETGCAFVTSAVESLDDRVLAALEKGHTRADFEAVVQHCRDADLVLAPTFVAFTPWTTIESYGDLLRTIDALDLVDHVAPIQLAIRLLVTEGSRLLDLHDVKAVIGPFNARSLTYPWLHPDPRVDALHKQVESLVRSNLTAPRRELFPRIWTLAHEAAGRVEQMQSDPNTAERSPIPRLSEPWYCCAEPI